MRSKEDVNYIISGLLMQLRQKKGLSKAKMADALGIDKHTWIRWESGASAPSIADLVMVYETMEEPILRPMIDILYPHEDDYHESTTAARKSIAEYILDKAPDRTIRMYRYMMERPEADQQLEEFCALNHLPLHYRFFVAQQIYVYYQMARQHGELIYTDTHMPDLDIFASGMKRVQKAAFDKLKSGGTK